MPKQTSTWKSVERKLARLFGVERNQDTHGDDFHTDLIAAPTLWPGFYWYYFECGFSPNGTCLFLYYSCWWVLFRANYCDGGTQ